MVWQKSRRPVMLWAAVIVACLLVVAATVYLSAVNKGQATSPPASPSSATASQGAETISSSPSPTASPLSSSEIAAIQTILGSGNDDLVRQLVPIATGETLADGFSSTLANMGLVLDHGSQRVIDGGAWEVLATDKQENRWILGLVLVDQSPRILYAERAPE